MKGIFIPLFLFLVLAPALISASETASFIFQRVYTPLGSSFNGEIAVKNIKATADTITVNITGYESARLKGLEGPIGSNYIISSDGRSATVSELKPNETQTIIVELFAPNPGEFNVQLSAQSNLGATSTDEMNITVQFPVSFSGLTDVWVLFLILLGVLVFGFGMRKPE
jgi:uncharacterized membrane protein